MNRVQNLVISSVIAHRQNLLQSRLVRLTDFVLEMLKLWVL
jgi:hypothetical protein